MITIIAAITEGKGAIGRRGDLVYHLSDDLRHFKALTTGHTVVMGRKTFESLPKGALPNRRNIVVTRNPGFAAEGIETAPSLTAALEMCDPAGETFIIGGGQVYAEALKVADRLSLTLVQAPDPEDADTFFPPVDPAMWEISDMTDTCADSRTGIPYRFVEFRRTQR